MQKFCCILIWRFTIVLLVFTRPLMGKLNFRGYLISRFYPICEIRENLMHAKNMCFTVHRFVVSFYRQMLLCRVTLGKSFLQFSAMKMAHAPPGHHSVIGRPSTGGLTYAEYVVYRGEQVPSVRLL